MQMQKPLWIAAGILFAVMSLAIHYQVKVAMHKHSGATRTLGKVRVDVSAPDFTLDDLAGKPVALGSYRGKKVVLLDFWATWCGPCKVALPGLQDLSDRYGERGLVVLTVDQREKPEQVRSFIERKQYSFGVVLDADGEVSDHYGVRGIPTSVLIDKQGIVRSIHVGGFGDEAQMQKLIERLIEE
jgi:peroxiredoxin